jgi:hypothetical protein
LGGEIAAQGENQAEKGLGKMTFFLYLHKREAPRAAASSALKSQRKAELVEVDCAKRKFLLHHTKGFPVE